MQRLTIFIIHPSDLLTDQRPNGDGLIAYGFIKALADRGHTLQIAARELDIENPLPKNVKLFRLQCWFRIPLLDRLEYMVRARLLFKTLRNTHDFDLLHQMNPVFAGLSLAFVGCKIPIVLGTIVPRWPKDPDSLSARLPLFSRMIEWIRNLILKLQQRHAAALLLTSRAALNKVPEPDRVASKIYPISHGIDSAMFSPGESSRSNSSSPTILFLASLLRKKGIFVLLEAYADLLKRVPEARLIIAGDGPETNEVARRVQGLGETANVQLMGRVDRATAIDLMREATLFCLPSFGEPYANTIIEAMSCGKPIVATDAGGIPSLLPAGGGLLVPPGDSSALASALEHILRDTEQQSRMGAINRKHVEQTLTWTAVVNRLEAIYSAVLSGADPQSMNSKALEECA